MKKIIRIGTRESQLAVWQATLIKNLLEKKGISAELVFIKSEGDIDLITPLYEMGVQGIFTRSLDVALLNNKIDIAVHSMKDVPTQLPDGMIQSAVLPRASHKDILVYKGSATEINNSLENGDSLLTIATSSIRRKAQWLNKYPAHTIENLRGNVNTRLQKVNDSNWNGAIFAAAGLERINLRPPNAIDLNWMLPAPAQGAIMVVCRQDDEFSFKATNNLNDSNTAICTKIERDFLRTLLGGCSTPISAFAQIENNQIIFNGNICSIDGKNKVDIKKVIEITEATTAGTMAANELLQNGGQKIVDTIRHA